VVDFNFVSIHLLPLVYRPQSSSASRLTAGAFGFLILIQLATAPTDKANPTHFDTHALAAELTGVLKDNFARADGTSGARSWPINTRSGAVLWPKDCGEYRQAAGTGGRWARSLLTGRQLLWVHSLACSVPRTQTE
jgi:hypothetical protein